ncbi:hypothetical protein MJO28_009483 [Puccinia striiformis f. sp. tritici]|uniref:Golgi apparatus membrane protein TVP38 n=4 Tax=Puccinia striiformis TaxID=27350 RepID=A0A0L0VIW8_9BASI|nr:hypothetical protein Pst134EA_017645 [Puccinia striiformis f. sp. tritici]KAI9607181.1 hypothetical protein H4Q26_005696 [Puccinia striiformis f. sp. tritici PST-130]KNE99208.1 hypothetical protein PSTG_07515 [Puccinia striiformis f. sp. tritici PST-78]POW03164.1 hypothetical protein PSTT_11243 [Puccinia striiformis]KAH9451039.1 hypothetical protein Pst134EB_018544 [Puccinia striiformis f. sp. tritici]KAH9461336.1 hypothetical protein Pst134EA_017645 [Puccinia striiformis f. sp. tritici]
MEPFNKPEEVPLHEKQPLQQSTAHRLPSPSREPSSSLQEPSRPGGAIISLADYPPGRDPHHAQPRLINPIRSPPLRSSSKANSQLLVPLTVEPIIQVDDPLAEPSTSLQQRQQRQFLTAQMAKGSSDSYRNERVTLSPLEPSHCITPDLPYRSATSSPTVLGQSPEKLCLTNSSDHYRSELAPGSKLKFHQRFVRAVRQEASECKQAGLEIAHFVKHHNWKQTFKNAVQRKYWGWWLLLLVVLILSSLLSSYHTKVALYLKPYQSQIKNASWSWIVPTILLIIVSFPPLFGHELIILVAGMIWGLWIGFAIACAGTFLGEILTYYAFKHLIGARSARVEAGSVTYASLAKLMREGGLGMVILVRASAMPGHVCTAMQATIGIGLWVFTIACVVTLPKQFALVYVGVLLGDPGLDPKDPLGVEATSKNDAESTSHHRISAAVFLLTGFFTILSAYIVWMRLRKIRPIVQQEFDARKLTDNSSDHPTNDQINLNEKPPQLVDHPFYQNSSSETQLPPRIYTHPLAV